MEDKNEMNQAISDAQHLQELRQRINEKAEKIINNGMGSKLGWLIAFVVIIVIEAWSYYFSWLEDYRAVIVWLIASAVTVIIIIMVLRHFLAAMKKAGNAPQQYRAAKRFIKTHQLGMYIVIAVAFLASDIFKTHGADFGAGVFASCLLIVIGIVRFSARPQSSIDKDFYNDVEELGEYR